MMALSAPLALAQSTGESAGDEVYELEDFVVTEQFLYTDQVNALKTPTPIIDVPQSLSIATSEQIKEQGFDSIGDVVNYTPGVNNAQGEGHRDAVVFRGSRSTADFFVDGVRDDVQYYRPLYNVEQLEILRGPNALLFGRGGTGGVINRVLKKGIIGSQFTEYQVTVDTFGAYGAQIDSNFGINEDSAFRINAFYEHLENHRDHYDGERFGVNPTVKFLFGEKTTLDVSYEYNDNERFIDRGIPTGDDGKPIESLDDVFFGDSELNESTFEAHVLRAALQHRFSDELKGRLDLAYGDYDKYYANFYTANYDEADEEVTLDGYADTTERQTLTLSSGLIGEFETGEIEHTVIFGAEYVTTQNDNDRFNPDFGASSLAGRSDQEVFKLSDIGDFSGGSGINAVGDSVTGNFTDLNDNTEADLNVISLYVQDEIALSENFDLILGARFDRIDFDVDLLDAGGNVTDSRSQVDEEITPRLGFVFKPKEHISLYASYSKSFLPQSGEQFASVGGNNIDLDPNEFTNLEAGIKWDFNNRMSMTAAIFELQQDAKDTDGAGNTFDIETEINGFEAQFLGQITDSWFVSAGYSYLDGEIKEEDASVIGNRPRELPKHSFSVWNRYDFTEKLSLGLGVIYQDETYITSDNDTELPSYFRIDAAAYYQLSENLRLQVNIENLLDEDYYPHAHGDHQVTVGAPIHARFAITGRF